MFLSVQTAAVRPLRVVSGNKAPLSVMLVSGEASSDEHGAALVRALFAQVPEAEVFGMGGSKLRQAGMETVVDSEHAAAVMGFSELFGSIGKLLKARKRLIREAKARRPDVVVLIDFPDFNLSLARALKRVGCSVLYFITPQLWAWRRGRVNRIRKTVRKVAPIFPFEENFFQRHGVDAEYVGHPFLDRAPVSETPAEFLRGLGLDPERPVIALLPGSRRAEAEFLLPPMLDAFERIRAGRPNFQAIIPVAPTLSRSWFEERVAGREAVFLVDGHAREVLNAARAAVVSSGTATVETALAGIPFVVVYRLAGLSFRIAKLLVRGVRWFAMPNLVAGKKVVPELLQDEVSPERIAVELERFLGDPALEAKMRKEIALVGERLRAGRRAGSTAAERTAEIVRELAEERTQPKAGWRSRREK